MKNKAQVLYFGVQAMVVAVSFLLCVPYSIASPTAAGTSTTTVKHDSPENYVPGFRISLDATIRDKAGFMAVKCFFKTKKQKHFVIVDMENSGSNYKATLPAPWVYSEYIDYYFVTVNKDKKIYRSQQFRMKEKESAAARRYQKIGEVKEARLDIAQDALEKYETLRENLSAESKNKLQKHQVNTNQNTLIIETEYNPAIEQLIGFYDKHVKVMVVDSPISDLSPTKTASTQTASPKSILPVKGKISSKAIIIGGVALAGGAAAIALGSSSSSDDSGGAGNYTGGGTSSGSCNGAISGGIGGTNNFVISMGKPSGNFDFGYDLIGTRISVHNGGNTIFDTGCTTGNGVIGLSYSGGDSNITVQVYPDCLGIDIGSWDFKVGCPKTTPRPTERPNPGG